MVSASIKLAARGNLKKHRRRGVEEGQVVRGAESGRRGEGGGSGDGGQDSLPEVISPAPLVGGGSPEPSGEG